ncbi:NADPH-dependent FMN reductase [Paenibacillus curdlanolyticus YK9]|uniref:NADPH-dependent FMN reductase n=1 Tax=Paenibacillus curdlanolyticus YK9 TaxID=717606 RepID=E0IB65_9BACL|nr:NADPH-dependent FMN reductase [Paenibacillus curdlanolyticus]EFM10356.1 NADPH-dependent FMN reductase [Paenibacillus curdlanolyticus YK9]
MNIVIIAGSNRKDATSTKLAEYANKYLTKQGHLVQLFDLYKQPLPFYSPDVTPEPDGAVAELQQAMLQADGVILATPEYHGSISGVLKNALDFLGQTHFNGKTVLSASSAGGPIGTSSLLQLQAIVRNLHGVNSPEWISIGYGQHSALSEASGDYEQSNPVFDRIHLALRTFIDLAERLSGEPARV